MLREQNQKQQSSYHRCSTQALQSVATVLTPFVSKHHRVIVSPGGFFAAIARSTWREDDFPKIFETDTAPYASRIVAGCSTVHGEKLTIGIGHSAPLTAEDVDIVSKIITPELEWMTTADITMRRIGAVIHPAALLHGLDLLGDEETMFYDHFVPAAGQLIDQVRRGTMRNPAVARRAQLIHGGNHSKSTLTLQGMGRPRHLPRPSRITACATPLTVASRRQRPPASAATGTSKKTLP